jgi:hypothetical protein
VPATLLARSRQKLALQRRMFVEDLEDAEKIFVLKRNDSLALGEVLPVWSCLRGYGDNTLLYVVVADAGHLPGTMEQRAPGLLCGYIDRFAPHDDAHDLFDACWISICRNAYAMWSEARRNTGARLLAAEWCQRLNSLTHQQARLGSAQTRQGRAAPGPAFLKE